MDNCRPFRDRDLIGICRYIIQYCETNISTPVTFSTENASAFHSFLPSLLTYIFGSPNIRGWLQTDTQSEQDRAIHDLLHPKGAFVLALIKLSTEKKYFYDMVTEKLPDDIRRILAAGAIQYLPRVYNNCVHLDTSKITKIKDLRSAATRQSSLFPRTNVGDYKIRFSMIQFYLYYMISVATWPSLSIPTIQSTNLNSNNSMYNNINNNNNNNNNSFYSASSKPISYGSPSLITSTSSSVNRPVTRSNNTTIAPSPIISATSTSSTSGSTSGSIYGSSSSSTTSVNSAQNLPYLIPGQVRSLQESIYSKLIQEYFHEFIPCIINESTSYHPIIGTFFLDALIEIWIRTVWVSSSQKLSIIYMQSIHQFIKYIVSGDLRRCISYKQNNNNNDNNNSNNNNINNSNIDSSEGEEEDDNNKEEKDDSKLTSDYAKIYHIIKNEYYLLLSRLSINWRKQDDYIWVLDLWKLWAAPWRLGNDNLTISTTTTITSTKIWDDLELKTIPAPLEDGWAFFILDNSWYYLTLVNQFLQRTTTFTYIEKPIVNSNINTLGIMMNNNTSNNNVNNNIIKSTSISSLDGNSIYVELGILYQLLSIWKCKNIVSYLGLIEDGLERIAHEKPMNQLNKKTSSSSSSNSISSLMSNTRNKLISLSTSLQLQHGKPAKDELFETLAMISCHGNKSNILPIQQKLRSIHNCIMSVSNDQQHWQSSNIYSNERHPRSEVLLKTIDTLHNIIITRQQQQQQSRGKLGAPNWTNTVILGPSSTSSSVSSSKTVISIELKSLMNSENDLLKLFKINTPSNEGRSTPSITPSSQNIVIKDTSTSILNQSNMINKNGSSIKANIDNYNKSNNDNNNTFKPIPAYGPRAEEMVRSYENVYLVAWIVPFERKFNRLYSHWVVSWCPLIPNRIRFRWLAAPVNLVYLLFLFLILTVIIK